MIRSTALASAVIALSAILGVRASFAADLPQPPYTKVPAVYPEPVASWSGCYLGGNIGAGWDNTHDLGTAFAGTPFVPPFDYGYSNGTHFIGGGQIGCDYQFAANWLVGIQGKADFGSIQSMNQVQPFPAVTAAYELKNTEDLTARLGYIVTPAVLAYVKGGIAWANTNVSALALPILAEQADFTRTGFTVGGGIEWKFARNWTVFGEYNYYDFGTKNGNLYSTGLVPAFGAAGALSDSVSLRLHSQQALVGVNYRFDWANPVVAKY